MVLALQLFSVQQAKLSFLLSANVRLIKTFSGFDLPVALNCALQSQMALAECCLKDKISLMLTKKQGRSKLQKVLLKLYGGPRKGWHLC